MSWCPPQDQHSKLLRTLIQSPAPYHCSKYHHLKTVTLHLNHGRSWLRITKTIILEHHPKINPILSWSLHNHHDSRSLAVAILKTSSLKTNTSTSPPSLLAGKSQAFTPKHIGNPHQADKSVETLKFCSIVKVLSS